nr:hypothetical protein GCM10020092_012740 [Actinoplanes digitatis]
MCRHLAYLGVPVALSDLLFEAPHALVRQSWAPRDMRGGGTINADGFGVGWYPDHGAAPVRYRSAAPMWTDAALPALAAHTSAGCLLAAVRSATVGMPVVETAAAPFAEGDWLFSHNGVVAGWPDSLAALAGRLPVRDLVTLDAPTDAALLWALTRHRLRAGATPAEAVAATVAEVSAAAPGSRLNLLLTDGRADRRQRRRARPVRSGGRRVRTGQLRTHRSRTGLASRAGRPPARCHAIHAGHHRAREIMTALEIHLDDKYLDRTLRADVATGLTAMPKWLPPKWFYDARGSELFEDITRLPEYYPTRTERAILAARAAEIARITDAKALVELGSGSSEKTCLLLDALLDHGTLGAFTPLDVSSAALEDAVDRLVARYPGLAVRGVVGDLTRHLAHIPDGDNRMVAFLGGTIGNLAPAERADFLGWLRAVLRTGEWLLLGTDLVKDPSVVVPAYDDAAGVTAEFNRNVLRVVNRSAGCRLRPGRVRARRALGRRAGVDRDAAEGHLGAADPDPRPRPDGGLRRR